MLVSARRWVAFLLFSISKLGCLAFILVESTLSSSQPGRRFSALGQKLSQSHTSWYCSPRKYVHTRITHVHTPVMSRSSLVRTPHAHFLVSRLAAP